jgi:hypothetical protein
MTYNVSINQNNYQPAETSESQIAEFLREHSEVEMSVPVMIGVLATSHFQMRGLQALLLNLAVASLSRQIFTKLKQPASESAQANSTNGKNGKTAQPIQMGPGYAIVHSVPGRIRLRIERLSNKPSFAKRLEQLIIADDHVIDVRINPAAASVRIYYQTGVLSDLDLSLRLMNIINKAESEEYSETSAPKPVQS